MKKKYLAVIPARGGSKGIHKKNIKELAGKPLIGYTIEPALQMVKNGIIDRLIVSTDDEEIAAVSRDFGADVPFLRPAEISGDKAKSVDAIVHALDWTENQGEYYDAVLTLQCTSPQRIAEDIENSVRLFDENNADSLISVYENRKANGYNYYRREGNIGIPVRKEHNQGVRRQEMPEMYVRNGAMYISSNSLLRDRKLIIGDNPLLYVMPTERSVDVDSAEDFEYVQWLMRKRMKSSD